MLFSQKYRLYNLKISSKGAGKITENHESFVTASTYTKRMLDLLHAHNALNTPNERLFNKLEIKLVNSFDPIFTDQLSLAGKIQMLREFCDPALVSKFDADMSKARWLVILRESIDETPDDMTVRYLLGFKF